MSKKDIKKARKAAEKSEAVAKAQKSFKNEKTKDVEVEVGVVGIVMVGDRDQLGPLQISKGARINEFALQSSHSLYDRLLLTNFHPLSFRSNIVCTQTSAAWSINASTIIGSRMMTLLQIERAMATGTRF